MPISVKRQPGGFTGLLGKSLPRYPEETGAADPQTLTAAPAALCASTPWVAALIAS
jgi:hypothetical protein